MRLHATLMAAVVLGLATYAAGDDTAKTTQEKLQGKWKMVKLVTSGEEQPAQKVQQYRLTVKGNEYEVRVGDRTIKLAFKLLPNTKPQAIDLTYVDGDNKGDVNKAIIEVEGDTFKMCRHREVGRERPTKFISDEGTQLILTEWERDK
jgi:uncharacterized protein (TIGR03067 family)